MNDERNHSETNRRLERIETKVDDLSAAMISIARAEERITTIFSSLEGHSARLLKHSERLDGVEADCAKSAGFGRIFERAAWLAVTFALAWLLGQKEF